MANQKSFHHRNLKQALYEAAVSLLDAESVSAVTIRAVARQVGVSHAAPVNHYRDRRALLKAIALQQFQLILDDAKQRLQMPELSPEQRIEAIPEALLDFGLSYPNRYHLLWRKDLIDYNDPEIADITDRLYNGLCDEIQQAMPDSPFDRDTVAIALWSLVHGYADMRQNGMFEDKVDAVNGLPRRKAMLAFFRKALGIGEEVRLRRR